MKQYQRRLKKKRKRNDNNDILVIVMNGGLLSAILDISRLYPNLTNEELIEHFIDTIEEDLPDIVESVGLPMTPSPIERKLELLRQTRVKKKYRRFDTVESVEFVNQLRKAQYILAAESTSERASDTDYANIGINTSSLIANSIFGPGSAVTEEEVISEGRCFNSERTPEWTDVPDTDMIFIDISPTFKEKITESPEILRKKNTQEHFGRIIDGISNEIGRVPELRHEDYQVDIFVRHDIELPQWEQTIVQFKIRNKNFDEKMETWDSIDLYIRKVIADLKKNAIKEGVNPAEIDEINRNLFIDVELP